MQSDTGDTKDIQRKLDQALKDVDDYKAKYDKIKKVNKAFVISFMFIIAKDLQEFFSQSSHEIFVSLLYIFLSFISYISF